MLFRMFFLWRIYYLNFRPAHQAPYITLAYMDLSLDQWRMCWFNTEQGASIIISSCVSRVIWCFKCFTSYISTAVASTRYNLPYWIDAVLPCARLTHHSSSIWSMSGVCWEGDRPTLSQHRVNVSLPRGSNGARSPRIQISGENTGYQHTLAPGGARPRLPLVQPDMSTYSQLRFQVCDTSCIWL